MSSLNQLISECAHMVGQPNNIPLRRHIRQNIIHLRNELVRQSFNRHNYIDKQLWQRYKITLINVPEGDVVGADFGQYVKRSERKILKPVRFTDNLPLKSVRTLGINTVEIAHVKEAGGRFYKSLPGMCAMPVYDLINYYLYIDYTNSRFTDLGAVIIEAPFEYPHLVPEETNAGAITTPVDDDDEFLLPEDMIPQLKELMIKRGLLEVPHETNETPKDNLVNG